MPRSSRYSTSPVAVVRRYFGLSQLELSQYLDVTQGLLASIESGRRGLSVALEQQLYPLLAAIPAQTDPAAPPLLPTNLGEPDRDPLLARLDDCQQQARLLRRQLRPLEETARLAARWQVALPGLLATLPGTADAPAPDPATPGGWPAWLAWFRRRWLTRRPTALLPDASARYHLLRLRAEAFETEAAALAALLATGAAPPA